MAYGNLTNTTWLYNGDIMEYDGILRGYHERLMDGYTLRCHQTWQLKIPYGYFMGKILIGCTSPTGHVGFGGLFQGASCQLG